MSQIGLWYVTEDGPKKLKQSSIDLEQHLEGWIEQNPDLLQQGLRIVGRQVQVEAGRLDLLALDPVGRWIVVEIKKKNVHRDAVAQVIDYASCLSTLPYTELEQKVNAYLAEQGTSLKALLAERKALEDAESDTRDVIMFVAGVGKDPGLDRMAEYLSGTYQVPINLVSYQVFELASGQCVMVRELTEAGIESPVLVKATSLAVKDICDLAERSGVGKEFQAILATARKHNLYPRPYKESIMYTPPADRRRMLFTVRATPKADGTLRVYIGPKVFAEFGLAPEEDATSILGEDGWREMSSEHVEEFTASLDRLLGESVQAG